MSSITRNVLIARGVSANVKFLDQRKTHDRVIAKCPSISSSDITITLDREHGFFVGTIDGEIISKSREPQVAFRRAVRKTWRKAAAH